MSNNQAFVDAFGKPLTRNVEEREGHRGNSAQQTQPFCEPASDDELNSDPNDDIRDDDPFVGPGDGMPFLREWEDPAIIAMYLQRADDVVERDLIVNIIKLHQKLDANLSRAIKSQPDYSLAKGCFEAAQSLMGSLLGNMRTLSAHRKYTSQVVSVFRTSGQRIGMQAKIQEIRERDEAAEADLIDRLESLHATFDEVGDLFEARANQCQNALKDPSYAFYMAGRGPTLASTKLLVAWRKLSAEAQRQAALALDLRVKLARSRSQVVVIDDATKPFHATQCDSREKPTRPH